MWHYTGGMIPEGMPPLDPRDRSFYWAITTAVLLAVAIAAFCTNN